MQKSSDRFGWRAKAMLSAAGVATFVLPIVLATPYVAPSTIHAGLQDQASVAAKFKFDVVSIKLNKAGPIVVKTDFPPDGFIGTAVSVKMLIRGAYGSMSDFGYDEDVTVEGPEWITSERYDVDARIDGSVIEVLDKLAVRDRVAARQQMVQALLADRFKLTFHRETRVLPVFWLSIAKDGPKIHEANPDDTYSKGMKDDLGIGHGNLMSLRPGQIIGQGISMASLRRMLALPLGRTVLDKTGLTGMYDFTLKWSPEQPQYSAVLVDEATGQPVVTPSNAPGASLFSAIQEQLGLRLESGKGAVEVIVIDHIERPSGN